MRLKYQNKQHFKTPFLNLPSEVVISGAANKR